jgi:transposase
MPWRDTGCCNRGTRTRSRGGYRAMRRKAWLDSWPPSTVGIAGGCCAEGEAVKEGLRETLRAGPGEAARREVTVGASGPAPSRWTLRTIRASVDWLTAYTVRGVWRMWPTCGLGLHTSWARLFSPDPDYGSKGRRRHRCRRDAARHPETVGALFLDEFGYPRWPEVAPTGGGEAAVAQRAGTNQQWRTIGALKALTGQVHYLAGYIVGRHQVRQFYSRLARAYPKTGELIYAIHDNWNIHTQPDVLTALADYPRIKPVWLPTSAPWLNPIEKRWRWLRHDVLKMHRGVEDWPQVKHRGHDCLDQFAHGSATLLRYVGLKGKGKLATVINTS